MIVLGIETSCDETAVAIVTNDKKILSNLIYTQQVHLDYGGVVPELAARAHLQKLMPLISQALFEANLKITDMDAIAATAGPGLIGGVMVGVMVAKGLCLKNNIPFLPINHLEGHALTVRLTHDIEFPYLLLLTSGGHCQFLYVEGVGRYELLGQTIDDAAGECFDKVAKTLGLDYPGGPEIERLARFGNPVAYPFPIPLKGRSGCDFSFSGLKTSVRVTIENIEKTRTLTLEDKQNICASFQRTIALSMIDRLKNAINLCKVPPKNFVIAGGVAANLYLRQELNTYLSDLNINLIAPPMALCTDNAAMIAWAGIERLAKGDSFDLNFKPRPRWPLSELN